MMDKGIIEAITITDGKVRPYPLNPENPDSNKLHLAFKKPVGREIYYRRKTNKIMFEVYKVLITHKNSMVDKRLIETYINYYSSIKKFLKNTKKNPTNRIPNIDSCIDSIMGIFKPPFAH